MKYPDYPATDPNFMEMLDHTCNIFHMVRKEDKTVGFGIEKGTPHFEYPAEPDECAVPCHFNNKGSGTQSVNETSHNRELAERKKLQLPLEVDIRANDKIVHLETGLEYTAEPPPPPIRDHHQIVWVYRSQTQRPL